MGAVRRLELNLLTAHEGVNHRRQRRFRVRIASAWRRADRSGGRPRHAIDEATIVASMAGAFCDVVAIAATRAGRRGRGSRERSRELGPPRRAARGIEAAGP